MPQSQAVFHFIVPGLFEAVSAASNLSPRGSFPSLEKLLARAARSRLELDYPHILAQLFQMPLDEGADVPVAALAAAGLAGHDDISGSFWLKATPVLLKPDRDRLVLHEAKFDPDNSAGLESLMHELKVHFSPLFSEMLPTADSAWLFRCDTDYKISTTPLIDATGRNIDNLLPGGDDYKKWHQVLNEIQMLLHARDSLQMGFNALWLEGAGCLPVSDQKHEDIAVLGGDSDLQNLLKWSEAHNLPALQDAAVAGFTAIVSSELSVMQAIRMRSQEKWLKAVQITDRQLSEAMKMLAKGEFGSINLYPVNGSVFKLDRKDLLKFWKRPRSLAVSGY